MPSTSVLEAIGNTPLVQLRSVVPGGAARVFIKLEYYNPTGSYKDRMALSTIEGAERQGKLRPGMRVVEYTGGSTGSSLALVCAVKGYRFTPISSDAFAREKLDTMRAFGGELMMVPSDGGKINAELFARFREAVAREAADPNVFWADQFNNPDVVEGYAAMGQELLAQLDSRIHAFCAAVGSGGMLVGVSRALKAGGCTARVVALEPAESPLLSTGRRIASRGRCRRGLPAAAPAARRLRRNPRGTGGCRARHGAAARSRGGHFRRHVHGPQRHCGRRTGSPAWTRGDGGDSSCR